MGVIYLKELRSYFKSFFGWLFLAVFTAFCSLFFVIYNIRYGNPYLSTTVNSLVIILMFVFPLLTMRVLSEEKKLKTDQLILTSPVSVTSVVMGKFFALVTMMCLASLVLLVGLLIMSFYGSIPVPQNLMAVLALVLMGSVFASIGIFFSSLTEHQFFSAIMTYGAFIFIMLIPSALQIFFSSNKVISTIGSAIDFLAPFDKLLTGILNLADILRILSIIAIFIILSIRMFGKSSLSVAFVGAKKFWFSTLGTFALIAIIIGANVGVSFIPEGKIQKDFTRNGVYSLTDETKKVLSEVNEDITINVLTDETTADSGLKVYLENYTAANSHIKVKYHSTATESSFYMNYTSTAPSVGSLIIVKGDKSFVVDSQDFYRTEFDYTTYSNVETGVDIEGQITAAINALQSDVEYKVYFVEGHSELALTEGTAERMKKAGFTTASLSLMTTDAIPSDCNVLVVNGPKNDFSKDDIQKLNDYLDNGGYAVFVASHNDIPTPNYDAFLSTFGATIQAGTIQETNRMNVYQGVSTYVVPETVAHEITNNVYSKRRANLFIDTRGFLIDESEDVNRSVEALYMTTDASYAVEYDENGEIKDADNLVQGPFALGFFATKSTANGQAKITVLGSPVFLYQEIDEVTAYANSDVFVDALSYMCDQSLTASVPVKSYEATDLFIEEGLALLYAALLVVVLPLAEIIAGIVIVIVRRRK